MSITEYMAHRAEAFALLQKANPDKPISHADLLREIERLMSVPG